MENIISIFFRHKKKEQALAYLRSSTGQSPSAERHVLESLQYADQNVLKELSMSEDRPQMRKFVREGESIALNPEGIQHVTIAKVAGIRQIHDAGYLIGGKGQLFINGGSVGFNIDSDNKNRDETIRILQQIALTITVLKG